MNVIKIMEIITNNFVKKISKIMFKKNLFLKVAFRKIIFKTLAELLQNLTRIKNCTYIGNIYGI